MLLRIHQHAWVSCCTGSSLAREFAEIAGFLAARRLLLGKRRGPAAP